MPTEQPPHLSPKPNLLRRIRGVLSNFFDPESARPPVPLVPTHPSHPSHPSQSQVTPLRTAASSNYPYDAGGTGRRSIGWQPTRLGPTTTIWGSLDQMRARARDEIRNNPWGEAAVSNFESQVIGNGIRPRWNIQNKALKKKIEREFDLWSRRCDFHGRSNFYGIQATAAREIFESGEVFVRYIVRPRSFMRSEKLRVPLQLQLIESEQLPIFRNVAPTEAGSTMMPVENSIRTGIEFDPQGRRIAYHMYKEHPGETMFYPLEGLIFIRVPASDILHVYKPSRAGMLRGQPHLASVLTLLYEIDQYTDAELARKKIQAMFAGFIETPTTDTDILPIDPNNQTATVQAVPIAGTTLPQDLGTVIAKIESGTMQQLLPGEKITFPQLPADQTIEAFLRVMMHRFAAGIGATYEQITGDLKGVNYSSIRSGLVEFRRKCEQLQRNIFIFQLLQPIVERWMEEAVMVGVLDLPGYAEEPEKYTAEIVWSRPGWAWVDPKADADATLMKIRAGLTTRAHEVSNLGEDVADIDNEQAADNERADELGLVYDSRPDQILIGRESNPALPELTDVGESGEADKGDTPPEGAAQPDTKPQQPKRNVAPAPKPNQPRKAASGPARRVSDR